MSALLLELLAYVVAAAMALFIGYCLLGLLARFFMWRDWMALPASERAALRRLDGKR